MKNIQDFGNKIKRLLDDDAIFHGLLVLLVGVTAFGLGRSSVVPESMEQPASITLSQSMTQQGGTTTPVSEDMGDGTAVEGAYVGSKNSDKYHLPWCSGAQRIKEENKVWFASIEAAEQAGYIPAGNCEGL